ncbi:hypothetical protein NQ315_007522 [Exocentrus adspersus]|uniref:RAP domain-containing protein n=1 Tax=Exocentrus adspersus TaxID=1586481 RepID=A0AAV8W7L1_9CUCU|nr:hypothetical protein NQ315_007522 [Exocentrus adspersus]
MLYGRDKDLLELLLHKFEQHSNRLKESDCLKISHSLFLLKNKRIKRTSPEQIKHVNALLRERTKYLLLQVDNSDFIGWSTLLKAAVLRGDYDSELVEDLLIKFKELDYMSSKLVESISYLLSNTRSLIPEIINKCTEYVINHKSNILGFNAEKLLYSCYTLAYHPVNGDKFFEDVIDVILRDQERLSGLSFLQSALSLCYFNKLPSSFIKQIFNVEFMEKLDSELENCYSKDRYPQRVRKILMALNRAVCLEYPEYNVPWFHQKYIEDMQKISVKNTDKMYHHRINEYLAQVLQNPQSISKDVVTPYGYHIDFVVNFNSRGDPVSSESSDINRRVAVLLFYPYDFTQFYTHLKGKYQMKMRHLEIFGYEVAAVNFSQWINLLYPEERLEFISKLIWPETNTNTSVLPKR